MSGTLVLNPLGANPTKCSKTLKKFVGKLPAICLSVFGHFVELALKELTNFTHSRPNPGRRDKNNLTFFSNFVVPQKVL